VNLVTVEHDEAWLERVQRHIPATLMALWHPHLARPSATGRVASKRAPGFFDAYVAAPIAMASSPQFDVVCIDGRARNACAAVAVQVATSFIIFDNSDRADYHMAESILKKWGVPECYSGSGPQGGGIKWQTDLYRKI